MFHKADREAHLITYHRRNHSTTHQLDAVAVDVPSPSSVHWIVAAPSVTVTGGLLPVPIVDERELDQRREYEGRAGVHPHVDRLPRYNMKLWPFQKHVSESKFTLM